VAALLLAAAAQGTGAGSLGDAVLLLQQALGAQPGTLGADLDSEDYMPHGHFRVGDHVLVQSVRGPDVGSWVKGSITGDGLHKDSYDVHVWAGSPLHRSRASVPLELLRNATLGERREAAELRALEAAERRAAALARRKALAEEARRKAEEEAQRRAEEKRRKEEAIQEAARQEAQRKAAAAAAQREAAAKQAAELEAKRKVQEEKLAKERRQAALKARTESKRAEKLRAEEAEFQQLRTPAEREAWMEAKLRREMQAKGRMNREAYAKARVQVFVRDLWGKEVQYVVRRTAPMKAVKRLACERFSLDCDSARFSWDGRVIEDSDTVGRLGMAKGSVITARGHFARRAAE